ncbi:MAG: DMT family transporter [Pseudomonadota bacterium]
MKTLVEPYRALWLRTSPELRGIILMSLSTVGFALMHTAIRYASFEMSPFQIAFFRNAFGIVIFAPIIIRNGVGFMRTKRLGAHAGRSVLNICAMFLYFNALAVTEVAHVTALSFSAPIFASILAVIVLGERFRIRRWLAIAIGFLGMLLIIRPGYIPIEAGPVMVILSTMFWAVVLTITKILSRTESSLTIVAYMNIFLALYSLPPALWFWTWPTVEGWLVLILIGITGTIAQLCVTQSLRETEPTVVMPFDFLKLIWATLLGLWVFGEVPDSFVWIGGSVIFASSLYLAWREAQLRKAEAPSISDRAP